MIEPTLDDLLEDELMAPVMRSAGVSAAELRAKLSEAARRLAGKATPMARQHCCSSC